MYTSPLRATLIASLLATSALACTEDTTNQAQIDLDAGTEDAAQNDAGDMGTLEDTIEDEDTSEPPSPFLTFRYQPEATDFYRTPWPSNGRLREGGTPDMSGFPDDESIIRSFLDTIEQEITGFASMPIFYLAMEGDLSDTSLPDPVASIEAGSPIQLMDLSPEGCGTLVPINASLRQGTDPFTKDHQLLQVRNVIGTVLRPGIPYGLLIKKSLGTPDGRSALRPDNFEQALQGDGTEQAASLEPLHTCATTANIDLDQIAVATVMTPQDPVKELRLLRDFVMDPDRLETRQIKNWRRSDPWSRNNRNLLSYEGVMEVPIFQNGTSPYEPTGGGFVQDDQGVPQVQRWEEVDLIIAMRTLEEPWEGPRPVLVFMDGTGWSPWNQLFSNWINEALDAGFVVASFMPQFHGGRGGFLGSPDLSSFNFLNPAAGRTNFRQQAAETSYFLRILREQIDGIEGLPALTLDKVVYGGQSQGSLCGALVAATETDYSAYVFNGLSANLTQTLLYRKDPVDFAGLIKTFFGIRDDLDEFHPVPQLMQTGAEVVDPHNYAIHWRGWDANPTGNHILVTNGLGDSTTTPRGMEHLTLSGNIAPIAPLAWEIDPENISNLEPTLLPVTGNTQSLSGDHLTIATYLNADTGHFTIYRRAFAREMAVNFWQSALTQDTPTISTTREFQCGDGHDDDQDGLIDCEDTDCDGRAPCNEQFCEDDLDNDNDGLINCEDPDCLGHTSCVETTCDDGIDDDFDTLTDCEDPDCASKAPCGEELCGDGVDDDNDGDMDCEDTDCARNALCVELNCGDREDSDGDGLTDCDDPDCLGSYLCIEVDCDDNEDNDSNGQTDCDDFVCQLRLDECRPPQEEACDDNDDNDEDGLTDCEDPDCATSCAQDTCADANLGVATGQMLFRGLLEDADDDYYAGDCVQLGDGGGTRDISLLWTAPETGIYTFSTYGSRADTVLSIYPDTCDRDQELACDDDAPPLRSSELRAEVQQGVSLVLVISAYDADAIEQVFLHIFPEEENP